MDYQELLTRAKLNDADVLNAYQYGSRVYGLTHAASDWDFIVVTTNKPNEQFSDNKINVSFQTPEEFQERLDAHEISQLECYFLDRSFVWKQTRKFRFKLSLPKLRHALSAKAANSFVKAKKKMEIPESRDLVIAKKSLFHSFRILDFGKQIAVHGRIVDYSSMNYLRDEIFSLYANEWIVLFETYKSKHNSIFTEFRNLAPKT